MAEQTKLSILDPDHLAGHSAYDLLLQASRGRVGLDRRWINAITHSPEAVSDLVRFGSEDHSEDPVLLEQDVIDLFHHFRAPEGLPYLLAIVLEDLYSIPNEVVETIASIGAPAVDPLLQMFAQVEAEDRGEVAFLLVSLGIKDPRILDALVKSLDTDWDDALFHFEIYRDPAAIPVLEKIAETADEEEKADIADTIKSIREPQPEPVEEAFDILEFYPETAGPDFEAMAEEDRLEFLSAPQPGFRLGAASSFFGEELSAQARARLLETARTDSDLDVRAAAWAAFFEHTEEEPELRKTLMDRLQDPATPAAEKAGLVVGLARHSDQPAVRETILELAEAPETRIRAVEAMWRSYDPAFSPAAGDYIDDPELEVKRNAMWAIGYLQIEDRADDLRQFFTHEDLRVEALHNYVLAAPGATTKKKMSALYEKVGDLANGFSDEERMAVEAGIDVRMVRAGLKPMFQREQDEIEEEEEGGEVAASAEPAEGQVPKVGRNEPCPCGSGRKYKKCHGA